MSVALVPGECVSNPDILPLPLYPFNTGLCTSHCTGLCTSHYVSALYIFKLNLLLDTISISVGLRKEYEVAIGCRLVCLPVWYLNTQILHNYNFACCFLWMWRTGFKHGNKSLEFCEGNSVAEYVTAVLWLYKRFLQTSVVSGTIRARNMQFWKVFPDGPCEICGKQSGTGIALTFQRPLLEYANAHS
jgi:hypothetical protein